MRTARQRAADVKLMVGATIAVLLVGGFIAGALLLVTSDDSAECGTLLAGSVDKVFDDLEAGPAFVTGGGPCSAWLALEDGDVSAYKVDQPGGCVLDVAGNELVCNGAPVDQSELEEYPVRLIEVDEVDTFVVDLGPPPAPTT